MEGVSASLLADKQLGADVLAWAVCPSQDVIACATADQLSCHRLNWQRLWLHTLRDGQGRPSSLAWHPEAALLGVGFDSGALLLLDPETGEVRREARAADCALTSLSWLDEADGPSMDAGGGSGWEADCVASGLAQWPGAGRLASRAARLAVLCAGDARGRVSLLTPALSLLARLDLSALASLAGDGQEPAPAGRVTILQAAATRSLRHLYVVWEAEGAGRQLSLLDLGGMAGARTSIRTLSGILEQLSAESAGCLELVGQAERQWREAAAAVGELRAKLAGLLQGHSAERLGPHADVEQLERLLVLGEAATPEGVLHHFLTTSLGEAGLKRIAKAVDGALSAAATASLAQLQARLGAVLTLAGLLHGLLLCEGYFDGVGLQAEAAAGLRRGAAGLAVAAEAARLWATAQQQRWRKLFAWLLQAARLMGAEAEPRAPADAASIRGTLRAMREGRLAAGLFAQAAEVSDGPQAGPAGSTEELEGGGGFEAQLERLAEACRQQAAAIPGRLSAGVRAAQHIALPGRGQPSASLLLAQTGRDAASDTAWLCCPAAGGGEVLALRLQPPSQQEPPRPQAALHEVSCARLRLVPGERLVDCAAVQMDGDVLVLLTKPEEGPAALTLLPLAAPCLRALSPSPATPPEALLAGKPTELSALSEAMACPLEAGVLVQPPLVVSGSRRVACVVAGARRVCVYDLEEEQG